MSKNTKNARNDRKAKIEALNRKQRGAEHRQGMVIVGVCVLVGLLIVGAAAYQPIKSSLDLRSFDDKSLADIGAPASACGETKTKKAEGNQEHVPVGTPVDYTESPPAFGAHYDQPDTMARKFYSSDRPDLRTLVHNLEHGYTLVWYDETVADDDDALNQLRGAASKFADDEDYRDKFKAVPWTSDDGDPFPGDAHVALTHWSAGGNGETDTSKQVGVWQYCSEFSGEALSTFMQEYPYFDSPEPSAM